MTRTRADLALDLDVPGNAEFRGTFSRLRDVGLQELCSPDSGSRCFSSSFFAVASSTVPLLDASAYSRDRLGHAVIDLLRSCW
jgi:hypothetical protein